MYKFSGSFIYLSDIHKLNFLQRAILIHSYLYYEQDVSIISDKQFDDICRQYMDLVQNFSEQSVVNESEYGYVFYDFDGSTGFHLWDRLIDHDKEKVQLIAEHIYIHYLKEKR